MKTLHIAPGDSAGGSLIQAIREAGRDDEVLPFLDDLSCGPIDPDDPSTRAAWWAPHHDATEVAARLGAFWQRVASTEDRLVVWFGRHSARELAFFSAWVERLGERPYRIIDVTGRRLPRKGRDGSIALSRPAQCVSILPPDALRSLLGQEQPIASHDRDQIGQHWRRLRSENALFRIVTETGLASAPIDHFDPLLVAQATQDWQTVARIVGHAMGHDPGGYFQVGDVMLRARIVALVGEGRLLADGDPWEMSCRVRLAADANRAD